MDITLDSRTLAFAVAIVNGILSLIMLVVWRTRKIYSGFGSWTAVHILLTIAFTLLALHGFISDFLSVVFGNLFQVTAIILIAEGNRRFFGRRRDPANLILPVLMLLGISYFLYVRDNLSARIVFVSICSTIICTLYAIDLAHSTSRELRSPSWFKSGVLFLFGLVHLYRAVNAWLYPVSDDLYSPSLGQASIYIAAMVFSVAVAYGFLVLTTHRLELELKSTQAELLRLATTDHLTGISNGRQFFELSRRELNHSLRSQRNMSLIILDIDHFKQVNDTYGHAAGDMVIKAVAATLQSNLRQTDILARMGGDEFVVLLPETDLERCMIVAERLSRAASELLVQTSGMPVHVTISIGATVLSVDDVDLDPLLKRADAALYEAKRCGRNQIMAAAHNVFTPNVAAIDFALSPLHPIDHCISSAIGN